MTWLAAMVRRANGHGVTRSRHRQGRQAERCAKQLHREQQRDETASDRFTDPTHPAIVLADGGRGRFETVGKWDYPTMSAPSDRRVL